MPFENANVPKDVQTAIAQRQAAAKTLAENPHLLTFDYLEEHDLPVFVRNNTNVGAMLVIDIKTKGGRTHTLDIQNTDIPYELTQTLTFDELRGSIGFMKSLRNRTLILMDPTKAMEFLTQPAVQRRLAKVQTSKFSKEASVVAPKSFAIAPMVNENIRPGAPEQDVAPQADPISGRLQALVGEYKTALEDKSLTEAAKTQAADDFEDKIADNARTFSLLDWTWLSREVSHPGVVAMAQQQIALLSQQG